MNYARSSELGSSSHNPPVLQDGIFTHYNNQKQSGTPNKTQFYAQAVYHHTYCTATTI